VSRAVAAGSGAPATGRVVSKPVLRIAEKYAPKADSLEALARFGLEAAPPGVDPPLAVVSADFKKNPSRLLVVLPSPTGNWGLWDDSLAAGSGEVVPLLRWATANGYALAALSPHAFSESPSSTWDGILRGSPARFVAVVAAGSAESLLYAALTPLHPLLYSRMRVVLVAAAAASISPQTAAPAPSKELQEHLEGVLVHIPEDWARLNAFALHQCMAQLLEERVERFQLAEMKKYAGFQGLKENDMPGLKRMPLDTRIKRLDRDRGDDELARLLKKHEKNAAGSAESEEEEPGVD